MDELESVIAGIVRPEPSLALDRRIKGLINRRRRRDLRRNGRGLRQHGSLRRRRGRALLLRGRWRYQQKRRERRYYAEVQHAKGRSKGKTVHSAVQLRIRVWRMHPASHKALAECRGDRDAAGWT